MTTSRSPKKSETLEVRLPHAAKAAFMAQCRARGEPASEAVRRFIDGELRALARPARPPWLRVVAAALAGLAVGAVAAPSFAHSAPSSCAAFERLDRDRDGVLSLAEFRNR